MNERLICSAMEFAFLFCYCNWCARLETSTRSRRRKAESEGGGTGGRGEAGRPAHPALLPTVWIGTMKRRSGSNKEAGRKRGEGDIKDENIKVGRFFFFLLGINEKKSSSLYPRQEQEWKVGVAGQRKELNSVCRSLRGVQSVLFISVLFYSSCSTWENAKFRNM